MNKQNRIMNCFSAYLNYTCRSIFLLLLVWGISAGLMVPAYAAGSSDAERYTKAYDALHGYLVYALDHYEKDEPSFKTYSRKPLEPLRKIPAARYKKGSDGIYRSDMESDGIASITLTGDLMCQSRQQTAAKEKYGRYEFDDNFAYLKSVFQASDFVVGNLETMLSERASYYSEQSKVEGRPQCNAPSTFLDALRGAGYDMVVTANNHNCDTGVRGIFQTMAHLDQYRLIHTGTFTHKSEKRYKIVEIDGIKVAFLSYARYYNTKNEYLTKTGQKILLNLYDKDRVKTDVAAARNAGAEYVIAYIHWGKEFVNEQNRTQETCAKELANAGVDYIVGSHPHALQPYTKITASDGRTVPVIYSMGNFVSHMTGKSVSRETIILQIKLKRNSKGKVFLLSDGYIPCRTNKSYNGNNYPTIPLMAPYNNGVIPATSRLAYPHIISVIGNKLDILGRFPLTNLDFDLVESKVAYTGSACKPEVQVKLATGKLLELGKDYTLSWRDNINVGYGTVTVNGKGNYSGSWNGQFTVCPEAVKITSLTELPNGFKVTYSKNLKETTGYQIQYSTSRKFSSSKWVTISDKNTSSYSVLGTHADMTYYVRVRCYKMLDGEKISSKWSAVKSVMTK